MTDPDNADQLLDKADALLGRYRHGAPATDTTADFPVLTEVVEVPAAAVATAAELPELVTDGANAPIDTLQLREQILATLAPELEKRLSDALKPRTAELLDFAMQTVQLELGLSIRAAVRSAVAEAVDEALEAQRRNTNAKNP